MPAQYLGIRLALFLLFALTGPPLAAAASNKQPPVNWQEQEFRHNNVQRWFRFYTPPNYSPGNAAILLLHGGTQSMRKIFGDQAGGSRAWIDVANGSGVLLIVPNGTNPKTRDTKGDKQNWNDYREGGEAADTKADDVGFLTSLLDTLQVRLAFDSKRVYVTGASNGGMMTYRLLVERPQYFAAAVAFIANLPQTNNPLPLPAAPTPLMIVNGTQDPLMKWDGGDIPHARGRVISTPATIDWWLKANHAQTVPIVTPLPNRDPKDPCQITQQRYPAQSQGAPVVLLKVEGGGHSIPSIAYPIPDGFLIRRLLGPACHSAEGAQLAWSFLRQYRRD